MKTCLLGLVCAANQCKSSQQSSNDENQKVSPFQPVPQSHPLNQRQTIDRKIPISGRSVRSQRMARNHFSALICCIRAKNAIRERYASMKVISSILGTWNYFFLILVRKTLKNTFWKIPISGWSVRSLRMGRYLSAASKCCTRAKNAIRERHASTRVDLSILSFLSARRHSNPDLGQRNLEKHFEENSYFRSVCKCLRHLPFEAESSGTSRGIEFTIRERHAKRHV